MLVIVINTKPKALGICPRVGYIYNHKQRQPGVGFEKMTDSQATPARRPEVRATRCLIVARHAGIRPLASDEETEAAEQGTGPAVALPPRTARVRAAGVRSGNDVPS
jgi:hypothetical protein